MKNQALFSSKDKCKKLKCHLLQFLFAALNVSDKNLFFKYQILSRVDTFMEEFHHLWKQIGPMAKLFRYKRNRHCSVNVIYLV